MRGGGAGWSFMGEDRGGWRVLTKTDRRGKNVKKLRRERWQGIKRR